MMRHSLQYRPLLAFLLLMISFAQVAIAAPVTLDASVFADNSDLTNAFAGVTLSLVEPEDPSHTVANATAAGTTFYGIGTGPWADLRWQKTSDPGDFDDSRGLFRADFDAGTSFVSIETGSTGGGRCVWCPGSL